MMPNARTNQTSLAAQPDARHGAWPRVLSHRGLWRAEGEKNSPLAFARSFSEGFGTETDLRDRMWELVVSHDPPGPGAMPAEQLLRLHDRHGAGLPLALNIKADGLHEQVEELVRHHGLKDYFLFDMSVPDMRGYLKRGLRVFTRQSDAEPAPAFYEQAAGVWLDAFESDWMTEAVLAGHLSAGKEVCIVSPELHGRPAEEFWRRLAGMASAHQPGVMLCTDRPHEARRALNGED